MRAVSVKAPATVPDRASVSTVSLPIKSKVAPPNTVTTALSDRRSAAPSVSVPLLTSTVPASDVPAKVLDPVELSAPSPRLALAVPPVRA